MSVFFSLAFLLWGSSVSGQAPELHRWEYDPELNPQWINAWVPTPEEVYLANLQSENTQRRVHAAQELVLQSRAGVINQAEALEVATRQLERDLQQGNVPRQALLALTSAALAMVSKTEQCETIWSIVEQDSVLRPLIEPHLVNWSSDVALSQWRSRVTTESSNSSHIIVALEGIAQVGDSSDCDSIRKLMLDAGTLLPIQLAAAKTLGQLATGGEIEIASGLLERGVAQAELLAARLLAGHPAESAQAIREQILASNNQPARAVAYEGTARHWPERAHELAADLVADPENNLRLLAVQVLNEQDDEVSLNMQAKLLADSNRVVRETVRHNLVAKASDPQLRLQIDDVVSHFLLSDQWQGIEQAIYLAASLQDHSRSPALTGLLDHERYQVSIRAAWALQQLNIEEAELAAMHEHCQAITERLAANKPVDFEEAVRIAFCFEAMGQHYYEPAVDMLLRYVPKGDQRMGRPSRASAVYALGYIFKDKKNKKLARDLAKRMLDDNPLDPEDVTVQYASAIALGRIGHPDSIPELQERLGGGPALALESAARWSLEQLGQTTP